MEEVITNKDGPIRERAAIRCARATMLLYSLASSRDLTGAEEEIKDLKIRLAMEKKTKNQIKLCSFMELLLLVILVLLLSTFLLVFFLGSL